MTGNIMATVCKLEHMTFGVLYNINEKNKMC